MKLNGILLLCLTVRCLLNEVSILGAALDGEAFHRELTNLYNFSPRTLEVGEWTAKSTQLDKFWARVKDRRDECLPLVRVELSDFSNPPVFMFDGGKLLLTLSNATNSCEIVLRAFLYSDDRDMRPSYYLSVY